LCGFFSEDVLLGSGAFGVVKKGSVQISKDDDNNATTINNKRRQTIAIKALKSSVEIDDFKGFLSEVKIISIF
jgi:hypothetical protein